MPERIVELPRQTRRAVWLEVAFILGLFFLFAGGPPPDVNEAHYLAKAKHYWNPSWCGGDVFLDSANPHLAFYWLAGCLTSWGSLTATAWIGRLVTWALMAVAWQRLSWAVVPQRMASVATAALFLVLVDRGNLAGEWMVGGVEAKSLAYALVLFGLRCIVLGQWRAVWGWLGAASALHVLVGGWSVVAAALCWLLGDQSRTRLSTMLPYLILGACLSLLGLVPALELSSGVAATVAAQANEIYVFERLPHHLLIHQFAGARIGSFAILLVGWLGLGWYLRDQLRWWSMNFFAAAALMISIAGVVIDVTTRAHPGLAAQLLKFYWYRLADIAIPLAVAIGIAVALTKLAQKRPKLARRGWALAVIVPGLLIGQRFVELQIDFRPRAVSQSRPMGRNDAGDLRQRYRAWRDVCQWIGQQTPPDCRFLTPRSQQTFKWYAGREELANWKDIPQDAESIVRWWQRFEEVYTPDVFVNGLGSWSDPQLQQIATRHGIDYILVDRARTSRRLGFHRVYPTRAMPNASFEVYKVYPAASEE